MQTMLSFAAIAKETFAMTATLPAESLPQARIALIEAALGAFAEHGINGVSLRTIVARAGQHNQSAIHYHFGNKQGLIAAVLAHVEALLQPEMQHCLQELAARAAHAWTPDSLTELLCRPFILLDISSRSGHEAIKFMSRLTWQEGNQGQLMLVQAVQPYFMQFSAALLALNPGKPVDALTLQVYLGVNTLIHGLADASLLTRSPTDGVEQLRSHKPSLMQRYFIAYIAGGLCSPVSEPVTRHTDSAAELL